jgi:hypothetical protein
MLVCWVSRPWAWIRCCLTSIPESAISINSSWGLCPCTGCYRQRITNWRYGSLVAHEGQFQRALKLLVLLKGIRGCGLAVMFLEWKCIWIFLSNQPLWTYASSVYICVKWELSYRGPLLFTSSNEVKSGFSVKKNSHLFVSMCIWGLCPQGYGRHNLLRTVSCIRQSLTAEEDLVPCWIASSWRR